MALTKQQKELAADILGEELLEQVIGEAESRSKELEEAGIAHKAADTETETEEETSEDAEPEAEEEELEEEGQKDAEPEEGEEAPEGEPESEDEKAETAQVEVDVKAIAEQLASIFEVKLDPMTELAEQVQGLAQDVKALRDEVQAVKGEEAIKSQVETPRFVLNLTKKASEAEETEVDAGDPLLKMKPVERQVKVSGAANFFGPDKS